MLVHASFTQPRSETSAYSCSPTENRRMSSAAERKEQYKQVSAKIQNLVFGGKFEIELSPLRFARTSRRTTVGCRPTGGACPPSSRPTLAQRRRLRPRREASRRRKRRRYESMLCGIMSLLKPTCLIWLFGLGLIIDSIYRQ